jgi:tRNA(Ile)-lysidine synthetase-like protein
MKFWTLDQLSNNFNKTMDPSKKILLALSGGPDSLLCFLLLLKSPVKSWGIVVVNHKKDPKNFHQEQSYIKNLAQYYNIPWFIHYLSEEYNEFPINQNFFRKFRQEKIILTAYENNCDTVIVGHNMEDNVDTYLMRIGKGTSIYGACGIWPQNIKYGIEFLRPLLDVSRANIQRIMKNYGYFLDPTRKMDFQRNQLRRFHHTMENLGLSLYNIHLTTKKNQQWLSHLNMYLDSIKMGYNWVLIEDFDQYNPLIKHHLINHGVKHIIPHQWVSVDYDPVDGQTAHGCWFFKKKDLLITRQPIPQNQPSQWTIQQGKTFHVLGRLWVKNQTKNSIAVQLMDQWPHGVPTAGFLKKNKSILKTMVFITTSNGYILDNSCRSLDQNNIKNNIIYMDFNGFFIIIDDGIF